MKKTRKWFFPILLALLVAATSMLPAFLRGSEKETEKEATVRTAKPERRDIASTLSGTGTLLSQEYLDVGIPYGVEVTEYLVSNGDTVEKGQKLAGVDPVSVLEAISVCRETMDYLEEQMFALEYHQSTRYIMVPDTGTVKALYCSPGDKVSDVMLKYGCLAVIDINGEEWEAQAFNGTVKFINAAEGAAVYHNSTFIMLDDIEETSAYDTLLAEYKKYEAIMGQLAALYRDEAVLSPGNGIVDGIREEADGAEQNSDRESILEKLTELAAQEKNPERPRPDPSMPSGNDELPDMPVGFEPGRPSADSSERQPVRAENAAAVLNGKKIIRVMPAVYEGEKNTEIAAKAVASGDYVEGRIENNMVIIGEKTYFTEGDIVNMGNFTPQNGKKYLFLESCTEPEEPAEEKTEDLKYIAVYELPDSGSGQDPQGNQGDKRENHEMEGGERSSGAGMKQGGMGGGTGASSTETEEESFEMYPSEETVILSVIPDESLSIEITVDELDFLNVHIGQEAIVTIDAVPGRSYEGTVTAVNSSASINTGGQTKFSATVTIEKKADLLAGMNASTLIVIGTKENVLALPIKALCEEDGKTVVYSGYDEKKGELLNRIEVTTGESDGEYAEILSGLSENDTVKYEYCDTIDLDTMSAGTGIGLFDSFGLSGGTGGGRPFNGAAGRRP